MSKYIGIKSLDAEVCINLIEGKVIMDYSLNELFDPYESNLGISSDSEVTISRLDALFFIFKKAYYIILFLVYWFFTPFIFMLLIEKSKWREKYQYKHQLMMKRLHESQFGIYEYEVKGELKDDFILYKLSNNLWFEYELIGDYKDKIESIKLKRNVLNCKFNGMNVKKQDGWNVIFKFIKKPKYGKCILRYV